MSFTALRSALRVTRAVAAPVRATAFVAPRLFTTSSRVASDHQEPVIQGEGGKAGLVPTDLEQATGLERFELMMKLKGEDAFSVEPLEVIRMGTVADPIEVFSLDNTRIIGCTGFPVDTHETFLFTINKTKPTRCPECGCAFKVDYQGLPEDPHGHGHH